METANPVSLQPSEAQSNSASSPNQEGNEQKKSDIQSRYITFTKDGWIEARIHLGTGFYGICGFLKEVEDSARNFFAEMKRRDEEKSKLVNPGFRGFNLLKRK